MWYNAYRDAVSKTQGIAGASRIELAGTTKDGAEIFSFLIVEGEFFSR